MIKRQAQVFSAVLVVALLSAARSQPPSNAADLYREAAKLLPSEGDPELQKLRQGELSDAEVDRFLSQHTKLLQLVMQAAAIKQCDWGTDWSAGLNTALPHLVDCRTIADILKAQAQRMIAQGQWGEALHIAWALERLSQAAGAEKSTIAYLTSLGIRAKTLTLIADHLYALPNEQIDPYRKFVTGLTDAASPKAIASDAEMTIDWASRLSAEELNREVGKALQTDSVSLFADETQKVQLVARAKKILPALRELMQRPITEVVTVDETVKLIRDGGDAAKLLMGSQQGRTREVWRRVQYSRLFLLAALDVKEKGDDAVKTHIDPIGKKPFVLQRINPESFRISGTLLGNKEGERWDLVCK